MRIGILTNEYPPTCYGGAGVHVEYLTRELAALDEGRNFIRVLAFGDQANVRQTWSSTASRRRAILPRRTPATSSCSRPCSRTW